MFDLPMGLATALADGNCVLFAGAGIGHNTRTQKAATGSGADLRDMLAERFALSVDPTDDLAIVSQVIEIRHGREKLINAIEELLTGLEPDDDLRWLMSVPWKAIFTTNYDSVLERCYELDPSPTQVPVLMGANSEIATWQPPFEVPLIHLHGSLGTAAAKDAILVTQSDYSKFREKRQMLFDHLRLQYASSPIVYIGYSNRDGNWRTIIQEVEAQFAPNQAPTSYRVTPGTSEHERIVLEASKIQILDGTIKDLRQAYVDHFGSDEPPTRPTATTTNRTVPSDLTSIFEDSPAGLLRLLNSWEFVNQAAFDEEPNIFEFHRGDRPNWGLLGQGLSFERDLEPILVERLIDFATEPEPVARCELLVSPAGYGISTLLLSVATWFARQRSGCAILLLRPGQQPQSSDIEFIVEKWSGPVVLLIDNAADHVTALDEVWQSARDARAPVYMILAERSNEWQQVHPRLKPYEWELGPLSDEEIERLLASLEKTDTLGQLKDLTPALRFAAVKKRNQQDLLVTMREVTEGRAFDAIIEDEYRGISDTSAKEIYALVASFSRVNSLARDSLLMDATNSLSGDFYERVRSNLKGIIYAVTVDESRGIWAYTCRHRIIANIVWDRCIDAPRRRSLLSRALAALNLTFSVDARAFEGFTRDDYGIDSLNDFDAKTRFFEDACRKDGRNAYVRQHYARMLRREKKYELALSQIERAIQLRPNARSIEHTRGVILADLALDAGTEEMGRRRLAQSESAFRKALRANSRDEYSYKSLADLYLDWAKRCGSSVEAAEYATKAQNVVLEGLRFARNLEGLYLASSSIEQYLGHTPERIQALRLAVDSAPDSKVARYLLGMVLRREGSYPEAKEVLAGGLEAAPDDPNLAFAYALVLHEAGGSYASAISALQLASFSGIRQPNYVATLGGMLVMDGQGGEASEVWKRAWESRFSVADRNRVQFVPKESGESVELRGEVSELGSGRALLSCPGYPDFYCRASSYGAISVRRGVGVLFNPAFSARGPVGINLRIA